MHHMFVLLLHSLMIIIGDLFLNFRLVVITFFIVIVNIVTLCILVWIFKKVVM